MKFQRADMHPCTYKEYHLMKEEQKNIISYRLKVAEISTCNLLPSTCNVFTVISIDNVFQLIGLILIMPITG